MSAVPAMRESLVRRALPIYLALLFAILTLIGLLILRQLTNVLLILFVSLLFAAALSGPAERLHRRRVPLGLAVVLLYLVGLAVVGVTVWLIVPPLLEQIAAFAGRTPEYAERYGDLRTTWDSLRQDYPALGSFDAQVSRLTEGILARAGERIVDLPALLFSLLLDALSVLVISMLLVTNRERLFGFVLSLVHPSDRELVGGLLDKMWSRIGYYLRAKVIVMAIVGALTYVALLLIGVPFALPLAVIVALGETIPRAGPWLARIPLSGSRPSTACPRSGSRSSRRS